MPTIESSKFDLVQYNMSDVITFVRPVLGFSDQAHYIIISRPESEPFKWLQSIDDPSVCFVILDPRLVFKDYSVEVSPYDIRQLDGSETPEDYQIFGIVTVPKGHPEQMSINLQGPIVINSKNLNALQMVLNYPEFDIRYSLFDNMQMAK